MDAPPLAGDASTCATGIESHETTVVQWDSNASENETHRLKFGRDHHGIQLLLDAVDELQNSATISDHTPLTIPAAMVPMKDEFRSILISISPVKNRSGSDHSSSYTDSEFSSYSQEATNNNSSEIIPKQEILHLQCIAERMIAAGYSRECMEAYTSVRKNGVEERFKLLGIERVCSKKIQRLERQVLQHKIRLWIHAVKICIRSLFAGERAVANQIFNNLGTNFNIADYCFMTTVNDSAIKLFNFVEAITSIRRSPEKLFMILELHNMISDLLPEINIIFGSESGESIRKQAAEIGCSLSEAAREILSEFQKAVFGDLSTIPIPGGSVHPLTTYVMNYISLMAEYKQTLIELIVSKPTTHSSEVDFEFSEFEGNASPLVLHLVWITKILKCNLKGKCRHYKDACFAHFFMMNNVHYIARKINASIELKEMIGDDYLNKLTGEYKSAASNYLKTSWKRVMDCLIREESLQKLGSFLSGAVSRLVLRRIFKAFNAKLEKILTTQANWFVADVHLREEHRSSILEMLIPVYTSFLERHRSHIESWKHPEKYIKYSPEDVEKAVMNLFD